MPLLKSLKEKGFDVITITPKDEYTDRLISNGFIHYHIPIDRRGLALLSNFITIFSFLSLYCHIKPKMIIHFTIKPVIFGTLTARFCTKAKIVNNVTGLGYIFIGKTFLHKILKPFVRWMYWCVLRLSDLLIFQNEADRDFFIKSKIITEKIPPSILISGSGVDLDRFRRKNVKNKKSEVNFILIARMLYDKGIQEYIEAAKIVKRTFKNAIFYLVGDIDKGNPSAISSETINTWRQQGIVNYCGKVDDVVTFLENADVFVLPSYREGLSRSIIEAMAMELPIITTDVPGCRETVIEKENGLLVRPNNVPDLVQAMIFMINNPDKRLKMGKKSRLIAQDKFDVQQINQLYLSYLEQLC